MKAKCREFQSTNISWTKIHDSRSSSRRATRVLSLARVISQTDLCTSSSFWSTLPPAPQVQVAEPSPPRSAALTIFQAVDPGLMIPPFYCLFKLYLINYSFSRAPFVYWFEADQRSQEDRPTSFVAFIWALTSSGP